MINKEIVEVYNFKRKRLENRHKFVVTQCKAIAASFGVIDIVPSARGSSWRTSMRRKRAAGNLWFPLSVFSLELVVMYTCKKHSDPNRGGKTSYHALTVSAGAHVMSCPALSDPVRSPKNLPRSPISPRYSINNSILTIFVSEISLVLRRAFTFTLTPHCVHRKLGGKDLEGSTLRRGWIKTRGAERDTRIRGYGTYRYLRGDCQRLPATCARSPWYPDSLSARVDHSLADSAAVRRTHIWQSVVISRGPTIGCIGACAGTSSAGGKKRTHPRGRRIDVAARVANEGGERRGRGARGGDCRLSPPDTTGSPTRSGSLEAGSSTKPYHLSLSLSLSVSLRLSVSPSLSTLILLLFSFGLTPGRFSR